MCTVTYLPLSDHGFILTSNRDESPERRMEAWQTITIPSGETLHFPQDPLKGGTWFAASDHGRCACLLNGAFVPFQPDSRYTTSRGSIIPDFLESKRTDQWIEAARFESVAPFTLVLHDGDMLAEVVWDGQLRHVRHLEKHIPRIWSSVTLYPPEVRQWRQNLFRKWIDENPQITQEKIMAFHRSGGQGDPENDFVMNRAEEVKTLSITSLQSSQDFALLRYVNLDSGSEEIRQFKWQPLTYQS